MPALSKIDRLPDDVRIELFSRLAKTRFTDYESHSQWLRDKGFVVGKSALHSYVAANLKAIGDSVSGVDEVEATELAPHPMAVRLRCLSIAASLSGNLASVDTLFSVAEDLAAWVEGN